LPPNQFPPRALPARFRRTRVLIVGCGDVGQRVARQWQALAGHTGRHGPRVLALTSSPDKRPALQALGITPLLGNLDDAEQENAELKAKLLAAEKIISQQRHELKLQAQHRAEDKHARQLLDKNACQRRVEELEAKLLVARKYMRHDQKCNFKFGPCDCGYDQFNFEGEI
jgi:hypothetical protein